MRLIIATLLIIAVVMFSGNSEAQSQQLEVRFSSGDVSIAGTIMWPTRDGTVPGVVLVHGSGPGDRTELVEIANLFVAEGFAVLIYDKRGSGRSEGNWVTSSLDDLAADAAAGLVFLAEQPRVDPKKTGFWGISQGGWVVPLAAGLSSPAFAIVVTGGGMTPREVETARYRAVVQHSDASTSAIDKAERLIAAYFEYLSGSRTHALLQQEIDLVRNEAWFAPLGLEGVIPSPQNRRNWQWVAEFDPSESIRQLTIPVLVLLGGKDLLSPAGESARAWVEALSRGIRNSRVIVFQDAGHGLRTSAHGGELIREYFSTQFDWLRTVNVAQ